VPAVSLPLLTGPAGLPVGVQLVGRRGDDARLLRAAAWLMRFVKGPEPSPGLTPTCHPAKAGTW
jgi:Asp-tRNA(Asn)/Glu-tRNA(Gln) amidotransferase A subunit family amidase